MQDGAVGLYWMPDSCKLIYANTRGEPHHNVTSALPIIPQAAGWLPDNSLHQADETDLDLFNQCPIHLGSISLCSISPECHYTSSYLFYILKKPGLFGIWDECASFFIQITSSNRMLHFILCCTTGSVMEHGSVRVVPHRLIMLHAHCLIYGTKRSITRRLLFQFAWSFAISQPVPECTIALHLLYHKQHFM